MYDYLIVGCGFAGAVIAERLATVLGMRVLVVEKRSHPGGNCFDYLDKEGILVHKYGPHIFHTDDQAVFSYLSNFTEWRFYEHRVLASVEGKLLPIPINLDTVNGLYGMDLDSEGLKDYFARVSEDIENPANSKEVVTSKVGQDLYERFFEGYTRKMWGMEPENLAPEVAGRIPVRTDREDRYFTDRYQFMPGEGYAKLFGNLLASEKIDVRLNTDFSEVRGAVSAERIIYTGPIDEYFGFSLGRLPYRSLEFEFKTIDMERFQPVAVVNYPESNEFTRITEYRHMTGQEHEKTTISYEYPCDGPDPFYPVLTGENKRLADAYMEMAAREKGVTFIGRLAEYRYYTMEDVIKRALDVFEDIKKG